MIVAISTDGFIAGPNNDMSWVSKDDQKILAETMQKHTTLLMGMNTYHTHQHRFLAPNKTRIIFTRSKISPQDSRVRFANGTPADTLTELSASGTTEALLLGGAELYHYFLKKNLVDHLLLITEPVKLQSGTRLFANTEVLETEYNLVLESQRPLGTNGTVLSCYNKAKVS